MILNKKKEFTFRSVFVCKTIKKLKLARNFIIVVRVLLILKK